MAPATATTQLAVVGNLTMEQLGGHPAVHPEKEPEKPKRSADMGC